MNRTLTGALGAALLALLVAVAGVTVFEKILIAQGRGGPALRVAALKVAGSERTYRDKADGWF